MAITDIYQDLIMNPDYMPNRLQNLQNFPPVDTRTDVFNTAMYDDPNIPGYNFIDAPTSLSSRISNPQFLNNPRRGIIDNLIMQRGNPGVNLMTQARDAVTTGVGKGIDFGKAAIGGILSLVTGIPGVGALLSGLQSSPQGEDMKDFYGEMYGLDDIGRIASGPMKGYAPGDTLFGGPGLTGAIDKRINTITKTLKKKKSTVLEQRLKELEELKEKERQRSAQQLEEQRRGRRPGSGGDGPGTKDSGGPTGGYSYDSGGRQGFGYGLKKGGLVGLL